MTVAQFALYMFSSLVVLAAVAVVFSRNAVHAVLFLILAFFNGAGLFLLLGAEFLAMVLVIIYVGAVATLFLFVVMMLDVERIQKKEGLSQILPVGILVGLVLAIELFLVAAGWGEIGDQISKAPRDMPVESSVENTRAIGNVLYTDYFLLFQVSGLILLVAMIGSIVLTLRPGISVRRQNISSQNARSSKDSIEIRSVPPGHGV